MLIVKSEKPIVSSIFPVFPGFSEYPFAKLKILWGFTPREGSTPSFGTTRSLVYQRFPGFLLPYFFTLVTLHKIALAPKWHQLYFSGVLYHTRWHHHVKSIHHYFSMV